MLDDGTFDVGVSELEQVVHFEESSLLVSDRGLVDTRSTQSCGTSTDPFVISVRIRTVVDLLHRIVELVDMEVSAIVTTLHRVVRVEYGLLIYKEAHDYLDRLIVVIDVFHLPPELRLTHIEIY